MHIYIFSTDIARDRKELGTEFNVEGALVSLFERLQKASSEEDVKAEYIKAQHLKQVQRNLIDIQTRVVWFEAKFGSKKSLYEMFTQLLFYIHRALKDSEHIPPILCVVDSVKAAIMKTDVALSLLQDKNIHIK
ncbi:hypothetical protein [Fibrobacter sp.]|uniref:hypothetical protein n=1 Tax=Fibrobacter sp. TaxID=35828 RepID=UPI0025C67422|nr:hypothetical protein [Fibrobacter sp.]MBR3073702.1 hypothetical protein [Fibrobacter sp.]